MKDFISRLSRTETLFALYTLVTSTVLCATQRIDGTAWVAAATLISSAYVAGRSWVKRGEAENP